MGNTNFRKHRRRSVKNQNGRCFWCDGDMLTYRQAAGNQNHPQLCTSEHLVPRSALKDNSARNVVAACAKCNTARKDHPLEVWLPRVKFRLKQAGNPEHYETILKRLAACGITITIGIGPSQRSNAETGLTANESEARHGFETITPHA